MTVDEIKKIKVARVKCDNDLLFFTRYFFKKLKNQKFIVNWHHVEIAKYIEQVFDYALIFLNINIPPRCSKTELVLNAIARGLGKNPGGNYLYITASDDLRSETSVKIRDIISSDDFRLMYGLELKKDQNAKNLWRTKQGGGLKTATISGQITGFGAGQMIQHDEDLENYIRDFEGCIILDDINKISDSEDLNKNNEKVNSRIFDTVMSRTNSPDTPIINIQQRAGIEDATYNLLEYYEEEIINGKAKNLVMPIIFPDGKLLWEWKYDEEKINKLKISPKTSRIFETQYMQNPMPLEGLVYPNKFKTYKELPKETINENGVDIIKLQGWCIGAIDSADKGTDKFASPIVQVIGSNMYLKDVIFNTQELIDQEMPITQKSKQHKVSKWVVETNHAGNYFSKRMRTLLPNCDIFGQWNNANKMSRIIMQAGFLSKYLYVPENPTGEMMYFLDQCYRLQKTSKDKDDAPDSLSILSDHLERHYGIFNE